MTTSRIRIEPYSSEWEQQFRALEAIFQSHLGELISAVHHVGSTSVPGLAAKPVIDIDLVLAEGVALAAVVEQLGALGYAHLGDMGITDRDAFRLRPDAVPFPRSAGAWPVHHLYVCPAYSISLKNHLVLRDALRADPEAAAAYGALKQALAEHFPYEMDRYVDGKTGFITAVLKAAGFDAGAIGRIMSENRLKR